MEKKLLPLLVGFATVFGWAQVSRATVFVDEGFETNTTFDGTPSAILYESSAGDCECRTGQTVCAAGSGCGGAFGNSTSIQTNVKHTGTRSMRGDLNAAGGAGVNLDPNDYGFANKTNLYLRYYVYYAPGFRWYEWTKQVVWRIDNAPDMYINCGGRNWPFNFTNGATRCDLNVYFGMSPSGACYPDGGNVWPWNVDYGDPAWSVTHPSIGNMGEDWLMSPGGWYYVEAHLNTVTRRLDLWMMRPQDSSPTQIITNQTVAGCANFDGGGGEYFANLEADNYLNSTAGPSGGTYYIDDIVIADAYIGPLGGGSDTTPPSAPQGLAVI